MAEYQIAVAKGEMALTTIIVNVAACAQWQNRDDDYLNIYWREVSFAVKSRSSALGDQFCS
jgi:hypothetical protein